MPLRRVLFLDRDGVINERANPGEYVTSWHAFRFMEGVFELLRAAKTLGFYSVVITNQQCIGKGIASQQQVDELHRRMITEIALRGGCIEAVYVCPHLESARCDCRKPKPGLLQQAASQSRVPVDIAGSFFLGDSETDMIAGRSMGVQTILLADQFQGAVITTADRVARDFRQITEIIRG